MVQDVAQRALVAYLRSIFLQPNKAVFRVAELPVEEYALSLGLSTLPRLRFLKRGAKELLSDPLPDQHRYFAASLASFSCFLCGEVRSLPGPVDIAAAALPQAQGQGAFRTTARSTQVLPCLFSYNL